MPGRIFEVIPTAVNVQAFANFGYLAKRCHRRGGDPARHRQHPPRQKPSGCLAAARRDGSLRRIPINPSSSPTCLSSVGVNWTTNDTGRSWKAIAASADGSKLAAVVSGGQIYTSTNYGATWTPRYNNASWTCIASSADGTKLAATVTGNNYVYTSVDSGANWTQRTTSGLQIGRASLPHRTAPRLVACSPVAESPPRSILALIGPSWPTLFHSDGCCLFRQWFKSGRDGTRELRLCFQQRWRHGPTAPLPALDLCGSSARGSVLVAGISSGFSIPRPISA